MLGRLFLFKVSDMSENRLKTDSPKRKAPKTAFKPGASGNPGGRPPKTDEERTLEAMCRDKSMAALAVLTSIMESGENERNRITAAMAIIERGHGKAVQPTETNHSGSIAHTIEVVIVDPKG